MNRFLKGLGLCLLFIAPWIASRIVYHFRDDFNFKLTHYGQLLTPPIQTETLLHIAPAMGKWQLVYCLPLQCNESCKAKMNLLKNLHIVLGKDRDRVKLSSIEIKHSQAYPFLNEETVFIIDPKGWVVMYYLKENFQAKGVLEDMKRLLKFSHNG